YLPGPAQPQILLGDSETVVGLAHEGEAGAPCLAQRIAAHEQADGAPLPSPDPAPQLVELGEAEAVGALDNHQGRVGNIDPDLDDGGGDEDGQSALLEG